jgi:hypothetical protein
MAFLRLLGVFLRLFEGILVFFGHKKGHFRVNLIFIAQMLFRAAEEVKS